MKPHRLDPLLRPRSMAVVGASARADSFGHRLLRHIIDGGYGGRLHVVNPRYETLEERPCHATIADLPETVDHAVLAVANERIEEQLAAAIEAGARAATIFASLYDDDGGKPPLIERVRDRAREAGLPLCGGNCMGFYNFADNVRVCGYGTRETHQAGPVVYISHSGSGFIALVDTDDRIDFGLAVSAGQELTTTAADYMDYALGRPETRVIGLFLETVRDPQGFAAALAKANARNIPVVALKVGRSVGGARMAATHSGAIAGDAAAYQALFERYGVASVDSIEELATSLMMFAQPHPVGPGGLATIHDSGGERALTLDLAEAAGVPYAEVSPETLARVQEHLDPGLVAGNPLDAWGTGRGYEDLFRSTLALLTADPATAIGAMVCDRNPGGSIWPSYPGHLRAVNEATGKPMFLVSHHQGTGSDPAVIASTRAGFPILDGVQPFLKGIRQLFDWRDHLARPAMAPPEAPAEAVETWRARLAGDGPLNDLAAFALLDAFAVPVCRATLAGSRDDAIAAADDIGYPVVLKAAGLAHKSDVGGVVLGLGGAGAVGAAWDDLARRVGPGVVVMPMIEGGVEMILGASRDPQFGPVVTIGAGGIHAELLGDVAFALPPFDAAHARRMIDRLKLRPLLNGVRGAPACDLDALCDAAARFSVLAAALGDLVEGIDVNPIIVRPSGCLAVDALVVAGERGA